MARLDLGWSASRRKRKNLYGRTRQEVANKLTAALVRAKTGTLRSDERQTVEQYLHGWLRDVARPRVRPRTYETYEAAVRCHIVPALGRHRLAQLAPQHVQTWLARLESEGVSIGRRRYARVVLRTALNTALRWGLVTRNAAALAEAPRSVSREIRPLDPQQARRLLKTASTGSLYAFVAVALGCGLRLGEALGLQWADVDFDAGTIQVQRALQRFGGDRATRRPLLSERTRLLRLRSTAAQDAPNLAVIATQLADVRTKLRAMRTTVQLVEPKSLRSRRTIALPPVAVTALRTHRVQQLKVRLAAGAAWHDQGFVFTTSVGTPCDPHNIQKQFKKLLTEADLPACRIHDLRHSCASLLLAQGVDPRTIMETLGHSQISLTLNTYVHVSTTLQRDAAAKMDALLTDTESLGVS
jgi:integrase